MASPRCRQVARKATHGKAKQASSKNILLCDKKARKNKAVLVINRRRAVAVEVKATKAHRNIETAKAFLKNVSVSS